MVEYMRTILDLPESFTAEAMNNSHQRTKAAVIVTALEDLVRKKLNPGTQGLRGQG
jgi:putative antitoxin of VapBC-like toxin-antitoxin system